MENKHSNLWGLLKVEIKPSRKLGKTPSRRKLSAFPVSVLFRVSSFWLSLILLLKVSKHETGSLGNNKQQNERPGLPPATPASQQHQRPLTSSFSMDLKLKALLKSEDGVPLCLEQRCVSKQACQTETFESRKSVSIKSRRNSEGRKQAFREYQGEEGAECPVVLGKSHKMANCVPQPHLRRRERPFSQRKKGNGSEKRRQL